MPELDESKLVHDEAQAEKEAYQVKELVGDKIDTEFEKIIAMEQIPGMDEEIENSISEIKKLKENAIEDLESGTRFAKAMKSALKNVKNDGDSFHFNPEINFETPQDFNAFVKFIKVKFAPPLFFDSQQNSRDFGDLIADSSDIFFRIKGTNLAFVLKGGSEQRLALRKLKSKTIGYLTIYSPGWL